LAGGSLLGEDLDGAESDRFGAGDFGGHGLLIVSIPAFAVSNIHLADKLQAVFAGGPAEIFYVLFWESGLLRKKPGRLAIAE